MLSWCQDIVQTRLLSLTEPAQVSVLKLYATATQRMLMNTQHALQQLQTFDLVIETVS